MPEPIPISIKSVTMLTIPEEIFTSKGDQVPDRIRIGSQVFRLGDVDGGWCHYEQVTAEGPKTTGNFGAFQIPRIPPITKEIHEQPTDQQIVSAT